MILDAYASAPHYLSHIAPIWHALPPSMQGTFYVKTALVNDAEQRNIPVKQSVVLRSGNPMLVASYSDYLASGRRDVIFVEHGAGQTYKSHPNHRAYSGGDRRERVVLFVCPSERVASNNRARYPNTPTAIVGCPRLDSLHTQPRKPQSIPAVVAITFHADYNVAPETQSSFTYFHPMIKYLVDAGFNVLGHGHPNIYRRLARTYDRYGITHTNDPDYVLANADCLVVDNSSLGFEMASLNKPVVWLSPPHYRRNVHHGLRFWDALILGEEALTPEEVPAAVAKALSPIPVDLYHQRQEFIRTVYEHRDGHAAERAAEAIVRLMQERDVA